MPTTVSILLKSVGIEIERIRKVRWGEKVSSKMPGIYVVSLSPDPNVNAGILPTAPISFDALRQWLRGVPKLKLNGQINPSPEAIAERLTKLWLPDENIVYIGKTEVKLAERLRQYYSTILGDKGPHAGGCWIKTLVNYEQFNIYFAECSKPKEIEESLLGVFIDGVSEITKSGLHDPKHPFPYANLEYKIGTIRIIKKHGIEKWKR